MKIARKVLSIVLSIAMILSTIAVATVSSFAGKALNISMSLTAMPVSIESDWDEETGEIYDLYYTFYDEDGEEIDEPEDIEQSGEIEVEPGQDFIIRFYATSDYYVDSVQALVYAPIELLDTAQVVGEDYRAFADTKGLTNTDIEDQVRSYMFLCNTYTTGSGSRLKYFSDNSWIQSCMISSNKFTDAAFNTLLYQGLAAEAEEINANNSKNTADGNPYFTYTYGPDKTLGYSTIAGDDAKYGSNFMFLTGQNILKAAKLDGEDPHLCEFPIHIPSDAEAGTEYKVFIPSQNIRSAKNPDGKVFATISESTTYDPSQWQAYSADQVWDLSGATLTFVVPGGDEELDYSELEEACLAAADIDNDDETYTDASYNDFDEIRSTADAMLDGKTAETQDDIDDMTYDLTQAMENLALKADYSALNTALLKASVILDSSEDYAQDEKWDEFESALGAADDLDKDLEDTPDNQELIDTAAEDLETAISELNPVLADYDSYDEAVAAAKEALLHQTWYTEDSYSNLESAIIEYGDLSKELPISEQDTVDEATGEIMTALGNLEEVQAKEYEDLSDLIAGYKWDIQSGALKAADYTTDSWDAFTKAIADADTFCAGQKYTQREEDTNHYVLNAMVTLQGAYGNLEPQPADLAALTLAVAAAGALDLTNYEDDEAMTAFIDAFDTAAAYLMNEPQEGYPGSYQTVIDQAVADLTNAQKALNLKDADYTAVDEAIQRANDLDKTLYTDESLDKLAEAILAVDRTKKITEQDEVDAMAANINKIIDEDLEFKPADYTALEAEIEISSEITDSTAYTADSWGKFDDARTAANNVEKGKDIRYQATIDEAAGALTAARKALVGVGEADYSALNAALEEAGKKVQKNYTTTSWFTFSKAKTDAAAIEKGLNASHQGEIDAAAEALTEAMNNLVPLPANTEALEAAVSAAIAKIDNAYKYESVENLLSWLSAVRTEFNYTILEQDIVDELTGGINKAIEDLVWAEYKFTDEQDAKLAQMVQYAAEGKEDDFTTATWTAAADAFAAIYKITPFTYENEAAIGRAYDEFAVAFDDLTPASPANYKAVDDQIAIADELNSAHYTPDSWAEVETAIANVDRGLNENHQEEVDGMAQAIADAIANLVPYANYGLLDKFILDAEEIMDGDDYKHSYYTIDSTTAFINAYSAAVILDREILEEDQDIVDQAANNLYTAMQGLKIKGADYTALDEAIQTVATEYDQADYTPASWAVLADAVTAAKNVNRKLTIKDQKQVDDLVYDINQAITNLELKPVVQGTDVTDVQSTPTPYGEAATYALTITGRAIKFRFEDKDGNTWTFDRNGGDIQDHEGFQIVSYNAAGEVVSPESRKIAYEVWTVKANLAEGTYKVVAKYSGTGWEADDSKNYELTVVNKTDDNAYISSDYDTSGPAGRITVKVTTESNVQKVQLAMNGTTNTSTSFVTNDDGSRTFTLTAFTVKGENSISVSIKSNNKWYNDVDTLIYTAE